VQTGGTVASSGTLSLGVAGAGASAGTLSAAGGGVVAAADMALYDGSVLALAGGGAVVLGNAANNAYVVTVGSNATLSGDSGAIDVVAVQDGESPGALIVAGRLDASAGQVQIAAGASLVVENNMTVTVQASLSVGAGAMLTVDGTLALSGTVDGNGGAIRAGQFALAAVTLDNVALSQTGTGVVTIDGGLLLTGGAALDTAAAEIGNSVAATYTIGSASTLAVTAALTIESTAGYIGSLAAPEVVVASGGTLTAGTLDVLDEGGISITGSSAVAIGNAVPLAGALTVGSTGTLDGGWGQIAANVVLDGRLTDAAEAAQSGAPINPPPPSYGTFAIVGSLSGQGSIDLVDGGKAPTLTIGDAVAFQGSMSLAPDALLILGTGDMPSAQFSRGGTVDLASLTDESFNLPRYNATTGLLTVAGATPDAGLGFQQSDFSTQPDSGTGTEVVLPVTCFASGLRIACEHGDMAVEDLVAGTKVWTQNGRHAPVVWLGHRAVDCHRHPRPETVWPIRVAAHAFGPGRPARDLYLSPDHAVFRDGHLIPVRLLVDGGAIAQIPCDRVTYWHV